MQTRRSVLKLGALAPLAGAAVAFADKVPPRPANECISLDGPWLFRLDPLGQGEANAWHRPEHAAGGWRQVTVPHTWQIEPENAEYRGVAWYRRTLEAPPAWADRAVRIEFEAVFHTATVWVNGIQAGRHVGKGYTAFQIDAGPHLRLGEANVLAVRVDNAFDESMLPRGRSSDWAHDGGIYRPVHLLVTPQVLIERIWVDAEPDLASGKATIEVSAAVRNAASIAWDGTPAPCAWRGSAHIASCSVEAQY
jgi:beta-galactosidase